MKIHWWKRLQIGAETMLTVLVIWLCTLPLVGLFVLPFFEAQGTLLAAGMLFIMAFLLWRGISSWRVYEDR